ncbi:hypothetical protein IQ266_26835 [filamentous cyanobacterium LEGE 11480]|uniref:Secreted protein n=1 Tax=Romeriopsis navalis LEGE 11480 TaxID=2777977 RepID=A0A928VVI6_9CYAN|nr:hypothetical protein [Romeriopsis navalis]MBE9033355.1 hypothetical protein [Romeriopsis navalis LEGE 11480]
MKLKSLSLALGLTAGLVAIAAPAMAQYNDDAQANPLADFQTDNNDPFSGRGDSSSSMMNLMHRLMQGERADADSVAASQKDNMNNAMANFRAAQLKRMRERQAVKQGTIAIKGPKGLIMIPKAPKQQQFTAGTLKLAPMTIKPLVLPAE